MTDKETLREAVARVIDACDPDRIDHALCLRQADAAIATMFKRLRTPSKVMLEVGVENCSANWDEISCREFVPHIWQAMLAAFQQENSDATS